MENSKEIIKIHWKTFVENCLKDMLREGYIKDGNIVPDFLFADILKNNIINMAYYMHEGEDLIGISNIQKGLSVNKRAEARQQALVDKFQKSLINVTEFVLENKLVENTKNRKVTAFSLNGKHVFNTTIGFSSMCKYGWGDEELEMEHHFFCLTTKNKTIIDALSSVSKIKRFEYTSDVYFFADNEKEFGEIVKGLFHLFRES